MYSLCEIDAVHPVLKRVIETNITPERMSELMCELLDNGYEMENIQYKQRIIYEKGDTVSIKLATIQRYARKCHGRTDKISIRNILHVLKSMYGTPLPLEMFAKVKHKRLNRNSGGVFLLWQDTKGGEDIETNEHALTIFGYEFASPKFKKLSIDKTNDNVLSNEERVIKYLMIYNHWNEETAKAHLLYVSKAMEKAGCVFHRPKY